MANHILGDFIAAVNTTFESELVHFCTNYTLIISDYITYGRDLGQFNYVSNDYHNTSYDMHYKPTLINIPSPVHLPLFACIDIPIVPPCSCSPKSTNMTFT